MSLAEEENPREEIAVPTNGQGADAMLESPSLVADQQLAELRLALRD